MGSGDVLSATEERIKHTIIENQLRAGILGAGGTRVYTEGTYTVETEASTLTTVTLSGNPSLRGIANEGLIESFDVITWENLAANKTYYLYVRANTNTYRDPQDFSVVSSEVELITPDYLYLAKIITTSASPSNVPEIDTNPTNKATAFNLYSLLNTHTDPFGPALTQTILSVLRQFSVYLDQDRTALFSQLSEDATLPVITIVNSSDQPAIKSTTELKLADIRANMDLSDAANAAFRGTAESIIGALNEIFGTMQEHINDSEDPHGATLTQTNLIVQELATVTRLLINPNTANSPPEGPPGSPPSPPQDNEIESTGRLRFEDQWGAIDLADADNPFYRGTSGSIIGGLNELLQMVLTLSSDLASLTGLTVPGVSPFVLEVSPDDIKLPLHFKITVSESNAMTPAILVVESKASQEGWFYEDQVVPPTPPSPPLEDPNSVPDFYAVEPVKPLPTWKPLPSIGLIYEKQFKEDGTPVKVQYRPKQADQLFVHRKYHIAVQSYNGEYGDAELGTIVLG
jgi:hypothetical protein